MPKGAEAVQLVRLPRGAAVESLEGFRDGAWWVQDLAASSKLNAEWDYLQKLFQHGREWAQDWLDAHFDDIGVRSTLDLDEIWEDAPRPPVGAADAPAGEAED